MYRLYPQTQNYIYFTYIGECVRISVAWKERKLPTTISSINGIHNICGFIGWNVRKRGSDDAETVRT